MTRLLLIGAGNIATFAHLPALQTLEAEGMVDVVVWDLDRRKAEAVASDFEVASIRDWTDIASTVDAVSICVPPGPNAEIAVEAAGRGLHVLCEKPPGRTAAQAEAMAAAARPDRVTMIGFNRRSSPLYREAIRRSSELGAPTSLYGRCSRVAMGIDPSDTAADWITSDSSHVLDLAIATVGFPSAVSVSRRSVGTAADNVWTIQLHGAGGSAVLLFHYAGPRKVERYEWLGPGYDVSLEYPQQMSFAQLGRPPETIAHELSAHPTPEGSALRGFTDQYRTFLRAIAGDGPRPAHDFTYGSDFMRLIQVILESSSGSLHQVERSIRPSSPPATNLRSPEPARTRAAGAPARPRVLIQHPHSAQGAFFTPSDLAALADRCEVETWDPERLDRDALAQAQVVVAGRGAPPLPPDFVERARALELLVVLGASVRNFMPEPLMERGVIVVNTADAIAVGVAEHCLMVTLAGLRRLTEIDAGMHRGEWPQPGRSVARRKSRLRRLVPISLKRRLLALRSRGRGTPGGGRAAPIGAASDLRGQRVGLVGWGHTARRFAELLQPFGCDVLVFSEAADPAELAAFGARPASLGEVIGSTKVISLHRGLSEETRNFLNAERLALIQRGAVVVNTARGGLIDEEALVRRLGRGDIVAALDVFDEEPMAKTHPLRAFSNVILTPHNASATAQEAPRMGEQALHIILEWIDGNEVATIDAARLARMS